MEANILTNPIVIGMVNASFIVQIMLLSPNNKVKFFKLTKKLIDPISTDEDKLICIYDMLDILSEENQS